MSDAPTEEKTTAKPMMTKRQRSMVGMLVLVFAVFIVLFSGAQTLSLSETKRLLTELGTITSNQSSDRHNMELQHGAVRMEGWGFDKKAIISNVSFSISEQTPVDTKKISLSTQAVEVQKDTRLPRKYDMAFIEPINLIQDSHLSYIITSEKPLKLGLNYPDVASRFINRYDFEIPRRVTLTPAKTADETAQITERMLIQTSGGGAISFMNLAENEKAIKLNLPGFALTQGDRAILSADMVRADVTRNDAERVSGAYDIKIDKLNGAENQSDHYTVAIDGTYSADEIYMNYNLMQPVINNGTFEINKAALMGGDFQLMAAGTVSFSADDPLPHGALDIEITNANSLVASNLIPMPLKPLLETALKRASGAEGDLEEHTSLAIKRDKNGVLYLGNMTFEEITAAVLSDFMRNAMPMVQQDNIQGAPVADELPELPEGAPTLEEMPETIPVVPPAQELIVPSDPVPVVLEEAASEPESDTQTDAVEVPRGE